MQAEDINLLQLGLTCLCFPKARLRHCEDTTKEGKRTWKLVRKLGKIIVTLKRKIFGWIYMYKYAGKEKFAEKASQRIQ